MKTVVKFRIFRYDKEASYQDYELEVKKGMTISECLMAIKHKQDGSLSFRAGCRNGICGICALKVNGISRLGCKTQAWDEMGKEKEILIEPLSNLPLIKDLVVDMDPFWDDYVKVRPWLKCDSDPEKEHIMSRAEMKLLEGVSDCIMCGACYSECISKEADENFVGPAALVKAKRYSDDKRDSDSTRLKLYNETDKAWTCTDCELCGNVCPVGIAPMKEIFKLRRKIIESGLSGKGITHHKAFLKSVEKSGLLDEAKYPVQAIGFNPLRMKDIMPIGLRMMKSGKAPSIIHKKIDKIDEVRKIFKRLR